MNRIQVASMRPGFIIQENARRWMRSSSAPFSFNEAWIHHPGKRWRSRRTTRASIASMRPGFIIQENLTRRDINVYLQGASMRPGFIIQENGGLGFAALLPALLQ